MNEDNEPDSDFFKSRIDFIHIKPTENKIELSLISSIGKTYNFIFIGPKKFDFNFSRRS